MDSKILIKALKTAMREVIKEELTEILREGLQSTITEIKQSTPVLQPIQKNTTNQIKKSKIQFQDNKWADILNETNALSEDHSITMNSFRDIMNEGIEEIRMTSQDANNFGTMRKNIKESIEIAPVETKIMEDPETGTVLEVPQEIQHVMTRDYSSLMHAINKKRGIK